MEWVRRGTGLGVGEFPCLFLFNYSFPLSLDDSGVGLRGGVEHLTDGL